MAPSARRPFAAVIFDLDGTLVDSIGDIADGANKALAELGHPPRPVSDYHKLAGGGNRLLMSGALDTTDDTLLDRAVALKVAADAASDHAASVPFPGIATLLDGLASSGDSGGAPAPPPALAILSNKTEPFVKALTARLFPTVPFRVVAGANEHRPLKPDAGALGAVCRELGVAPSDAVLVGDTEVDMAAAAAAGATAVGVAWGFRGGDALRAGGGGAVVETVDELRAVLQAGVPLVAKQAVAVQEP